MPKNPEFLKYLTMYGILSEDAVLNLEGKYPEDTFALLLHLLKSGASRKNTLGRLWADSLGFSYVEMGTTLFQRDVVQLIPEQFARKHHAIPIYKFGEAVTVAMSDPAAKLVIQELSELLESPVSPVFSFAEEILEAIEIEYKTEEQLNDLSRKIVTDTIRIEDISELTRDQLQKVAGSQAVVEFVHGLLLMAVREGASDIHIEPGEEKVKIRFRVDGLLQERSRMENTLLAPVISRLKILANLDITERRRPQDGRINLKLPNRTIDFRFSSVPTVFGEKIVLRILGQSQALDVPDLTELVFSRSNLDMIKRITETPHGIFFVTGPTGSGKTTTLFSVLKFMNRPGVNITTIEDPVEYKLEGIAQVQVNMAVELDFAAALRSFLRQDPDIILVGEIRDMETAEIACQAALTGHLVLATLHTNSAIQAVTRLIDIGVKPFLVAPSLIGVLAQRLVRKICERCKEKYHPTSEELKELFTGDSLTENKEVFFYKGKGCPQCNFKGYSGRIAIHEVFYLDDFIRSMIARGETLSDIERYARRTGFQTMRYDGIKKVLRGLTTMEEVNRVTAAEEESSAEG